MYNLKLKREDIIGIYLNYKNDLKYEGVAVLKKKLEDGDSFFEDYERMYVEDFSKTQLGKLNDKKQLNLNKDYQSLSKYFSSTNPDIISFHKQLKKICSRRDTSYNRMYSLCQSFRELYSNNPTHSINALFKDHSNKIIVRYIQQTKIKEWNPTLFRAEKWLIEFPVQSDMKNNVLFNTPFRTTRWIKLLVKISPKEDKLRNELTRLTTYNSISNYDKYLERQEEIEDSIEDSSDSDFQLF